MKRSLTIPSALLCVLAITAISGCGGGDDGSGSGNSAAPEVDPNARVTVDQFIDGFAKETGVELTAQDFPGDASLLTFDDDGEIMETNEAESAFFEEYGNAQIFVVEPSGDVDLIFDVNTGESQSDEPVEFGGDIVRLVTNVAPEPDSDGVIWSEQCVRYEEQKSLNSCSWSGTKLYGQNVISKWTATSDALDEPAAKLNEAVAATVAGA